MPADVSDLPEIGGSSHEEAEDPPAEQLSRKELELEAELRAIELDVAILELRRDLEAQEGLVAEWAEWLRGAREDVLSHEWTEDERREERELRTGLQRADEVVGQLRQRLEALEGQRPARQAATAA